MTGTAARATSSPSGASVIVLTWNGRRWLQRCLDAVLALTPRVHELIVVDNGSEDGTADYLRREYPAVRVLTLEHNAGFAAGNNAGARIASGQYLVFLNNDTEVTPTWLAALQRPVDEDQQVGLVTSRLVFMDQPEIVDSAGDGYLRCGGAFKRGHGQRVAELADLAPGTKSGDVFGACGGAFLIRRPLFEALGGFDEDFFMVYEDVDLSYRAQLLGARCVYAHDAVVRHAGSASLGRASTRAVFYGQRNLEWTWLKNSPASLLWRSLGAHLAYDVAAAIGYARRGHLWTWCRAKVAALRGLPTVIAKRRAIARTRVVGPDALWALMDRDWVAIKRREKRFDVERR